MNVYKCPTTTKMIANPFILSIYNILCFINLNSL